MTNKIAFCTNAVVFHNNQILDQSCAKNYPGSEWVYYLSIYAKEQDIEVVTGDIAILNVQSKKWNASDILIVQEELAAHGDQLIKLGSKTFVLLCLESPVYAREFYAQLLKLSEKFKHRILFRGTFNKASSNGQNHIAYFPSFSEASIKKNISWNDRKFLVMVAANKYWKIIRPLHRQLVSWMRDFVLQKKSHLTAELIAQQLHDKRLELIEFFGKTHDLDLYGGGWENLNNLPKPWPEKLAPIISGLNPLRCENKHEVIAKYKFAICFENMSYPGYVTEKIIDCFTVGVIPIYMGAPDIAEFIPKNLYIDLREFSNYQELSQHLKSIPPEAAMEMINAGYAFLESSAGKNFSLECFAKKVLTLALNYNQ
jgi:hypothetical protein